MLVCLSDIPDRGLEIKTTLDLDRLNARLHEGSNQNQGIIFSAAPDVTLTIHRAGLGAQTKGTVSGTYIQDCSLCTDNVPRSVTARADILFKPRPLDAPPDDPDFFDDVGISYFSGDQVDLEPLLQEAIILPLSIFWHPEQDTSGKCLHCGKICTFGDPAERGTGGEVGGPRGTSLGDLLKKARQK